MEPKCYDAAVYMEKKRHKEKVRLAAQIDDGVYLGNLTISECGKRYAQTISFYGD